MNNTIEKHFTSNKESIIKWENNTNGLQAWNKEYLPKVTIKTVYPNWRRTLNGQPQRWNTKATGVTTSHKFWHLMRKLIFDFDKLDSTGKQSFVDTSMQSNDPMMDEAHGKAVFQQQLFLCNTTHYVITKVSHSAMEEISAQTLGIDNVIDIYFTDNTDKTGAWKCLSKAPITDSNLSDLDKIIATAPSSDQFILRTNCKAAGAS